MHIFSTLIFALSVLLAPSVRAESPEAVWTDTGVRSSVSATSESSDGGSASSSASSVIRSFGGETVVEVEASAEADGERVEIRETYEGEAVSADIRKESESGSASAEISVDVGDLEDGLDFSEDFMEDIVPEELDEMIDEELFEEEEAEMEGVSKWWSEVKEWFRKLF